VDIENYLKLVIGITLGISLLVFGFAFWNSATEDYYNKLNGKTYEIESCLQYMEAPLSSIGDRDDCLKKRQLGGAFMAVGTVILWGTLYLNKNYIEELMKNYKLI
tara:strand:+ start:136 stop:450 length:315 start_codon:yes stop_codon:yes gene_type:complete